MVLVDLISLTQGSNADRRSETDQNTDICQLKKNIKKKLSILKLTKVKLSVLSLLRVARGRFLNHS